MTPSDFVARGQTLMDRGQYQDAVRVCRLGLLANPAAVEGRLVLGSALLALRRHDEVLAEMRVALESDGTNARALALKGEALLRKGDARQAVEVLNRALRADPSSGVIGALLREAEAGVAEPVAASTTDYSFGDGDNTKHYPAHRGFGVGDDPSSAQVTRPTRALANAAVVAPDEEVLAVGDRSGTMEIDPDLDGVEVPDDLDDPPIAPPVAARAEDSEIMELDSDDLLSHSGARPVGPPNRRLLPDDATSDYRSAPADFDTGATEVGGAPADFPASPDTGVGTAPETPHGKPALAGAARRVRDQALGGDVDIDELFPDDESGLSSIEPVSGAARRGPPAEPGARTPGRAQPDDMHTIRAGLGLRDSSRRKVVRATPGLERKGAEETEHVRNRKKAAQREARKPAARPAAAGGNETQAIRKTTRVGGGGLRRIMYVVLALVVMGGGVFAGFEIRKIRLDRQIRSADAWGLLDDARQAPTRADTYANYVAARDAYARIVGVRDDERTRAALARAQAALAAEFGDGRDRAERLVAQLRGSDNRDALVARAYLAIAQAEAEPAARLAGEIIDRYPDLAEGPYLLGRSHLLGNRPEAAADAFRQALRVAQHAAIKVALGMAEAARGRYPEAQAAFDRALDMVPGHPAAIIGRARVSSRRVDLLSDPEQPEASLHAVIADGQRPLAEQRHGVSREQMGWAALALARVKLARGDEASARDAVGQAQAFRLEDDWEFSEALADALLRVGDAKGARAEAERAVERWPQRIEARVLLAEVALLRGRPDEALATLEQASDLSAHAHALTLRGLARLALGDLDAATDDLDAALALEPQRREAIVARARVDLARDDARAAVGRLQDLHGDDAAPELAITYAAALRRTGEVKKARPILELHLGGPLAGRAHLEMARLERDQGEFRAARTAFARSIELLQDATEARLEAALLALDTGDAAGAREALDALVEDRDKAGRVLVETARVHTLTGDVEGADELLTRAEKLDSAPRWLIARERGRSALRRGLPKAAVAELERAVSLKPDDGETRLLLIDAHLASENGPAARRTLTDVLKRFAARPEKQLALGRVDLYFDRLGDALAAFEKARAIYTEEKAPGRYLAETEYWIGRVYYYDNKLKAAHKVLTRAVDFNPAHVDAWFFLGLVELDRRRYKAAVAAFGKSVELDETALPQGWYYLGEAAHKARQWKKAREALGKYLELVPNGDLADEARKLLRRL